MRHVLLAVCLSLAAAPFASSAPDPDALDRALARTSLTRRDVGFEPRGWWSRYPAEIPYKLRHFDDLMREPFATLPWVRAMGRSVVEHLSPAAAGHRGVRGARPLHQAVFELGINRKLGTFRAYSANLIAEPTPLDDAVLECFRYAGRPSRYVTFGEESPYPMTEAQIRRAAARLPTEVSGILGQLVMNLIEARRWADRAFRNVPMELRLRVAARLDMARESVDALDYEPAADDVARLWDEASLWYAAIKTVDALDRAREALAPALLAHAKELEPFHGLFLRTPLGHVVVTGTGDDRGAGHEQTFLHVDLGGSDHWTSGLGGANPALPVSACLDMGGDDRYDTHHDRSYGSLGAGITGVGVLLDAGGDDSYGFVDLGQGFGQFGFGALIDLGGNDQYRARTSAQGAGVFGIGLLLDLAGDDFYEALAEAQGFGGVAGVGVLADRSGDDEYELEPDAERTGRPSYHSEGKVSVSNGQGCAMGRRGDGADGHSWAGGLGALLDADGNDTYLAGNWAQGCGYWFGMGALWDGGGDDRYTANGWAGAAGAHFCIGVLVDEAGDDVHTVSQNWGPAFGHDFTVAMLVNQGGNDRYVAGGDGIAWGINRSIACLFEIGGDDVYELSGKGRVPGTAADSERYADRHGTSLYWNEALSLALFLDVGGDDTYPAGPAGNDTGYTPEVRADNHSVFVDQPEGVVDLDRRHGSKR